jgi:hypothetical protein
MLENLPEESLSRREVTQRENLVVSLFDKRRRGTFDLVGELEMLSCDGLGGQGRRALLWARMCTGACIAGDSVSDVHLQPLGRCWRRFALLMMRYST